MYCLTRQSYCYEKDVEFRFGFYLNDNHVEELFGGVRNSFEFFLRLPEFGRQISYVCNNNIVESKLIFVREFAITLTSKNNL